LQAGYLAVVKTPVELVSLFWLKIPPEGIDLDGCDSQVFQAKESIHFEWGFKGNTADYDFV
jgi:hypothetical protein